jgi:hypothetical protein
MFFFRTEGWGRMGEKGEGKKGGEGDKKGEEKERAVN